MSLHRLLVTRERLIDELPLEESFAALLQHLGPVTPLELSMLGGRLASTPGRAFLAGYQGALRVLWPSAPASLGALCATEGRSLRPADLKTRLEGLTLNGQKDFVTAGESADWLLVAARSEPADAAPQLSLCVVYNGDPGVRCETLPALALMPDISHGRLHLRDAHCERLAGDGWDAYLKPFRTLEDVHVLAALTAWLWGIGQDCDWPRDLQLRLLGVLGGCIEAARCCPGEAAGHLLLGGLFEQFAALQVLLDTALANSPGDWARLWQRDRGVLGLSAAARAKRLDNAWAQYAGLLPAVL